jgi:methyltransferase
VSWLYAIVALVALQRLAELVYARRNESRLLARGGVEHGRRHYPLFVLLHAGWLLALTFGVPASRDPNWALITLYALLQPGRVWVIASLGPYWTTRVIALPTAKLVHTGPYRWLRHPNYLIVTAEIAVLPLAFEAVEIALLFSVLNAALLWHRIRVEERALAPLRKTATSARS